MSTPVRARVRKGSRVALAVMVVLAGVLFGSIAGAATNLVGDPSFEAGVSGWNTSGGASGVTLTQVAGGHSGSYAAKVTNTTSSNVDYCLLNDSPNWVRQTSTGAYQGYMWARADTAGATLTLRLREYSTSGTRLGLATSRIELTTEWRPVNVTLAVTSPGSTFDFSAYVVNAAPGTCFYADDAGVLQVPPPPPVTNLVGNAWFETGTSGWNTSGGASGVTLTQAAGGHTGLYGWPPPPGYAAKLTNTNISNVDYCLLNDSPNWVQQTVTGSYLGAMWVRADTAGATLTVRLREYSSSGTRLGVATNKIALTTDWQHVGVTLPVTSPGSTFDFSAYVANAAPGTCFSADDAAIIQVPPPSPTQVITFDEFDAPTTFGVPSTTTISSMGFTFAAEAIMKYPYSGCYEVCIDNGTPHLVHYGTSAERLSTMTRTGGGTFDLVAVDGGPLYVREPNLEPPIWNAVRIYVVGTKADSTQVSTTLVLAGGNWVDGPAAFQHFALPNGFTQLTSVTFYGNNYAQSGTGNNGSMAIDNIAVVIPT